MRTVLIIVLYFVIVCLCNRELANFRSLLEVQLNPTVYQVLFLPRHIGHGISLIVIISQLLLYIMISIFIFTLIFHDMLIPYAKSINQVYTHICEHPGRSHHQNLHPRQLLPPHRTGHDPEISPGSPQN